MNAVGRVFNKASGMIHRKTCGLVGYGSNMVPLSKVPANQRNKLKKCRVCKP